MAILYPDYDMKIKKGKIGYRRPKPHTSCLVDLLSAFIDLGITDEREALRLISRLQDSGFIIMKT